MKKTMIIAIAMLMLPAISGAWTLEWDANTEEDLAGYRVYMALSTTPTEFNQVAEVNTNCYPLLDSEDGNLFAVTAYDHAGNESAKSISIVFNIPEPPDTTAPGIPGNPRITDNTCTADVTQDGRVNVLDYLAYWRAWVGERGRADCIQVMN